MAGGASDTSYAGCPTFGSFSDSEMRPHKMLRDYIKQTIGFEDDILELMKKKVFGAIEKHPQYKKMSMIYRPFVLTSVSTMIDLTLLIEFLERAKSPEVCTRVTTMF